MKDYVVIFYNRFTCQTQVITINAKNKFRAGREFYRQYDKKQYYEAIETITEC